MKAAEHDEARDDPDAPPATADNPLVEGLERLPVHPTTLVIFGATGDLAKRKLLPAIYNLAHEGALPERFHLIGVSRQRHVPRGVPRSRPSEAITQFSRREPDPKVLEALLEHVRYVPGHVRRRRASTSACRQAARRVRPRGRASR